MIGGQRSVDILQSSLIAHQRAGPQALWRFRLKDLSVDERVWAWCRVFGQAHQGLNVGFILLQYSLVCNVESLSLFYLLFISCLYVQDGASKSYSCKPNIYVSWSTSELRVRLVPLNMFKPSSDFLLTVQGGASFVDLFCYLCFTYMIIGIALSSPAGNTLTCWLSCVWCFLVFCHFLIWCLGSGVVLYCIDSSSWLNLIYKFLYKPLIQQKLWIKIVTQDYLSRHVRNKWINLWVNKDYTEGL